VGLHGKKNLDADELSTAAHAPVRGVRHARAAVDNSPKSAYKG
jgi:hypothetical protein